MTYLSVMRMAIILPLCGMWICCAPDTSQDNEKKRQDPIQQGENPKFKFQDPKELDPGCAADAEQRQRYAQDAQKRWNADAKRRNLNSPYVFQTSGKCAEMLTISNRVFHPAETLKENGAFQGSLAREGFSTLKAVRGSETPIVIYSPESIENSETMREIREKLKRQTEGQPESRSQ